MSSKDVDLPGSKEHGILGKGTFGNRKISMFDVSDAEILQEMNTYPMSSPAAWFKKREGQSQIFQNHYAKVNGCKWAIHDSFRIQNIFGL